MAPSDWIAIIVIGASILTTAANLLYNYKTNQNNIKARRSDISIEKSLEAYREIVEVIIKLQNKLNMDELEGEEEKKKYYGELDDAYHEGQSVFHRYRYYLPKTFARKFYIIFSESYNLLRTRNFDLENITMISENFDTLVERLQKYAGIDIEK